MILGTNLTLIIATCVISIAAFNNGKLLSDLVMWPSEIVSRKQYYRFISSGFVHADIPHLAFNMLTLYFFGGLIEEAFELWSNSKLWYPVFYLFAIAAADIPSFLLNRHNRYYRSLGASGAVNAVLFAYIIISPWSLIQVFFIPMPAIVFAILYVAYSIYMDKRGRDQINHSAHLWGAAFGVLSILTLQPKLLPAFIDQLLHPQFNF